MNKEQILNHLSTRKDKISFAHYEDKINDVSLFTNTELFANFFNTKLILMGLNASRNIKGAYLNFHDDNKRSKDKIIKELINRVPEVEYCLMLDLFEEINPDSSTIDTSKEIEIQKTFAFIKPLLDIGAVVIAIGGKTYDILKKRKEVEGKVFKMIHYSQRTYKKQALLKIMENQLREALKHSN